MAILRVNPTRMELTRLKKRLKVAVRGHKLLKDKRDEMVRRFMELIRHNRELRLSVEGEIAKAQKSFTSASLTMHPTDLEQALLYPAKESRINVGKQNIMSVLVPTIEYKELPSKHSFYSYGLMSTSAELDVAVEKLADALPRLMELAQVEKTCNMLADEIEKTRRRVNALEYVMIPQLEETIKYITMKLDESERGNLTRLMKMKELMVDK